MISTAISPMCAVSRMVKAKEPDAVTVFIGPCIAKKSEANEHNIEGCLLYTSQGESQKKA